MGISVVIPLYNKERKIATSIESVLNQTWQVFEIVVVDDGSTDNSLREVKKITDGRIRIISQNNAGPSSARNRGVKDSNYEWILFLDADDELESDCLEHFVRLIKKNPYINVFVANLFMKSGYVFKRKSIYMKEGVVSNNFRAWFFETMNSCQGSVLYNKKVLQRHPYPETFKRWEDAAMFFEIIREESVYTSRKAVFTYCMDESSESHGRKDIKEDYLGYLNVESRSFWERMSLQLLYEQAKRIYPDQSKEIYGKGILKRREEILFKMFRCFYWLLRYNAKLLNTLNIYK